jgi:hypothetical protein
MICGIKLGQSVNESSKMMSEVDETDVVKT